MRSVKSIVAVLVLTLSAFTATAQDEWEFGIKGGIALNFMPYTTLDVGDRNSTNVGFQGGGFACVYLSDFWMGQAELLYSRKGITTINHLAENTVGGSALKFTRNIHYLQIPVMFGFHSLLNDRIKLMIGPELGICLGSEVVSNYDSPSYDANECNTFNLGIGLQATYYFTENLGFEVKFDYGLTRTFKAQEVYVKAGADRGHNAAAQFGLCYRFGY